MIAIPAMDISSGSIVRLRKGDYGDKTVYSKTPIEMAEDIEESGLKRLHFVDLDGAKEGFPQNLNIMKEISDKTGLEIDFGGGIRSWDSLEGAFSSGAKYVSVGSYAVKEREIMENWLSLYGSRLILSADSLDGKVRISGWSENSGEDVVQFIHDYYELGFKSVVATDISKDGMLEGPSLDLYRRILDRVPDIKVIASGGIRDSSDLWALRDVGVYAVIVGKALYEGRITLAEMREAEGAD